MSKVLEQINKLLQNKDFSKAKQLAENIDSEVDKYNILGIIHYHENNPEKSLEMFKKALETDPVNDDVLFNYSKVLFEKGDFFESWRYLTRIKTKTWEVYDLLGDTQLKQNNPAMALHYYKKALKLNNIKEMENKFKDIREKFKKEEKLAIFCLPGLDNFIKDIAEVLSNIYDVKLVVTTDGNEITNAYNWADIVWLEWANEMAVQITNKLSKENKKVICRLHGYEALRKDFLSKMNWNFIDKIIFVADNVLKTAIKNEPRIKNVSYKLIYNGIDLSKYTYSIRNSGENIVFVGHFNYKKNPVLALQILKRINDIGNYKLFWAGQMQDERMYNYINYLAEKLNLKEKFIFEGFKTNINDYLENKNLFLSTSIHEGYGVAILEAMSKGIKPAIHNFYVAEEFYPKEFVFNTIDEAVEMITNSDYDSEKYRRFVEEKCPFEKQIFQIVKTINETIEKTNIAKHIALLLSEKSKLNNFENLKSRVIEKIIKENDIKSVVEFNNKNDTLLKNFQGINYITIDFSDNFMKKNKTQEIVHDLSKPDLVICCDILSEINNGKKLKTLFNNVFKLSPEFILLFSPLKKFSTEQPDELHINFLQNLFVGENYSIKTIIEGENIEGIGFILFEKNKKILTIQNINDAIEIINEFMEPTIPLIKRFNFDESRVTVGKIEKLSNDLLNLDFTLKNGENRLIISGIIINSKTNAILYPKYIENSGKMREISKITQQILSQEFSEIGKSQIHSFVYDEKLLKEIEDNKTVYNWERGIPGTGFMPFFGFINVIMRYTFIRKIVGKVKTLLDAACGFGYGTSYLSKVADEAIGLDIARDSIDFCRETYNLDNINWVIGDVTKLPFDSEYFDVYVSYETLEHLPLNLVDTYLSEAYRVLKKGGKFIISTPNRLNRKNIRNPFHIKEYDILELNELLKKHFKKIDYYSIGEMSLYSGISNTSTGIIAIAHKTI